MLLIRLTVEDSATNTDISIVTVRVRKIVEKVLREIGIGGEPVGISCSEHHLFITDATGGNLSEYNL